MEVEPVSLLGLQQPMAAEVGAAAMVTSWGDCGGEYTPHCGISDPATTGDSWEGNKHTHTHTHTHKYIHFQEQQADVQSQTGKAA